MREIMLCSLFRSIHVCLTTRRAAIVLWTRLALPKIEQQRPRKRRDHALQQCLDACKYMAAFMAAIDDTDLVGMSPQVIPCLFVATRFLLSSAPCCLPL